MITHTVDAFEGGSVCVVGHPWRWLELNDKRVPILLDDIPGRVIKTSLEEYFGVVGAAERQRLLAVFLARHAALAAGYGVMPLKVWLEVPGTVPANDLDRTVASSVASVKCDP